MSNHPIADYREKAGLTKQGLAERIGVSRVAVSRWESGARKPGLAAVKKLAEITGIPARELRPDLAEVLE